MNGDAPERLDELMSLEALGLLDDDERAELRDAQQRSASIAGQLRAARQIVVGLALAVPLIDPPASLRERVLRSITGQAPPAGSTGSAGATGPTGSARSAGSDRSMKDARAAVAGPGAWPGWLAAAAALLCAIGIGAYALQLRARMQPMADRIDSAESRASAAERQLVDIRQALGAAQSETRTLRLQAAVLIAPDLARIDLAGQPAAPKAAARAFWSRQRGMVFAATQLPALPADRTYQLWVIPPGAGAAPISAGLLTPDATGGMTTHIATPPDMPTPLALAVTSEPAGGVPAPTGEKYLVGLTGL